MCRLCSIPWKWFYGAKAHGDSNRHSLPHQWRTPLGSALLVIALSIGIFFDTWSSIVHIWSHSSTFTYGFLVAPASAWLIWTRRDYYRQLAPTFSYLGLAAIFAAGFAWLAADLSHVLVVKQFAVVAMLVGGLWALLGAHVARKMLFPLAYLFFMVPVGEELIPPLIEFTTTFTVAMLRLTGLPVYREGHFFTLTSGNWSVVEACSGINYLIASVTLGFVFAYLNYNSYWKRGLFMLLSIIVPVIANGFRAYMIVMIGHLSDMTLAVGVDHLIYGGLFFGLVMLILFYLGSFWRDPAFKPPVIIANTTPIASYTHQQALLMLSAISLLFLVWPLNSSRLLTQLPDGGLPNNLTTMALPGWQRVNNPNWAWQPRFDGALAQHADFYSDGSKIVGLYLANFGKESQGHELVNSQNSLIQPHNRANARIIHSGSVALPSGVSVDEQVIKHPTQESVVLAWYQVGNTLTANAYRAKWQQLLKRLTGDTAPELKVILWTQTAHNEAEEALPVLQRFYASWIAHNGLLGKKNQANLK